MGTTGAISFFILLSLPAYLMLAALLLILGFLIIRSRSGTLKTLRSVKTELAGLKENLSKTRDALHDSEDRFKNLMDNSPTGILLIDREGNILEVNNKMLQILGSPGQEETKLINCLEYTPLKAVGLHEDILKSINTGQPVERKVEYKTKWGKKIHLDYSITPLKDKRNEVYNLILNAENRTESVLAERSRFESELQHRILIENSLQAMMIVQEGSVIFANSKIEELTGYSLDEIKKVGRRWLKLLIHPDDKQRAFRNVKNAMNRNEMDPRQVYKIIRKDSETRIMETLSAVVDFYEKPAMLIVAIDITETTIAQNKIIESEKRMRDLNAMKDKFFSIIAHDLKNPFSSILGFSNLLHEAYDNFSELQRKNFIKNICETSENTFKLLQNLLEWSRAQTGKIELFPRLLDAESLIAENLSVLKSGFLRKNILVTISIPSLTTIFADENMIKLVIRNLLSNALKFTPSGGRVEVIAEATDNESIITVKDSGIGIQKENLKRLFRIDDQLKTPGTEMESGSGLGLILCKEFIEKNNGRIWVHSKFGEGSAFSFSLPSKKPVQPMPLNS